MKALLREGSIRVYLMEAGGGKLALLALQAYDSTCFTSTRVQILTAEALEIDVLSLLALLVQEYKY